ncbi:class I SAM-dependent DNA methyltransferase [Arenibacterium sp. CAU 1754]
MSDPDTIRIYDARADDYARMTDDHNTRDPHLAAFIATCPSGGRVLDLGCGPGTSAAEMAKAGLVVDAVDASVEMVAMAARHPGVSARQATFDQIHASAEYDGVWANFSLLHAPRDAFPGHLAAIHRALKPGGVFYLGLKLGKGEARDQIGRFYTYYTEQQLETLLTRAGFTITNRIHGAGPGLDGTLSDWILVATHA